MSRTGAAAGRTRPRSGGWWCVTARTWRPWNGSTNAWRPWGSCSAYARSPELLACQILFVADPHDIRQSVLQCQPARTGGAICQPCARERSEEHTSELQSLMRISYAVFCLRQKKQKNMKTITEDKHKQM